MTLLVLTLDATFDMALLAVSADVGQLSIDMVPSLFDTEAGDDILLDSVVDVMLLESGINVILQDFAVDAYYKNPQLMIHYQVQQ